ncbi:SOS response-associated peptidase [Peribacillus glennii]|uniref:Abasic site processing protein n=1 Tax=Peribacillus glennii TaxID=2303991 RepID=A0A372L8W3_9BACI|nr:SOS response-associated peptidase [Peribacillus glennii]
MCGRYNLFSELKTIAERFQLMNSEVSELVPRYNIAPGQDIMAVRSDKNGNHAFFPRWGLVPTWAKDPKIGYKMINARAETLHEKPTFKRLLSRKRCLIVADGFYEWKKEKNGKQPYHIHLDDRSPFGFAGLWDEWENQGEVIHTCTIITTEANELMRDIHHRMPVILTRDSEEAWLDQADLSMTDLTELLVAYDPNAMFAYPISTFVNNSRNEGKDILNSL